MRKNIVAGNWKMNLDAEEASQFALNFIKHKNSFSEAVDIIVCPPAVHIQDLADIFYDFNIGVGGQNCSEHASGAFTGEISAGILKSVGASYVIIGHSERREYFNETSTQLAEKIKQALENNLTPIFCCGEPLSIRKENKHVAFVKQQLDEVFGELNQAQIKQLIIAYEPIWAIGTGETASPQQAQEIHHEIRKVLNNYIAENADEISILYGGSVKPSNAKELFSEIDIDGALVGGASLKPDDFLAIINSF